jgi:hypothetical protein
MSSGDITDALKLPSPCSCSQNIVRPSYDMLLRVRRNCLASTVYSVTTVCIDNTRSTGYAVGNYIQISFGSPYLLAYVKTVVSGKITDLIIVNRPVFSTIPSGWYSATTLTGTGSGAAVYVTVASNTCCSCNQASFTCVGANYVSIPVVYQK